MFERLIKSSILMAFAVILGMGLGGIGCENGAFCSADIECAADLICCGAEGNLPIGVCTDEATCDGPQGQAGDDCESDEECEQPGLFCNDGTCQFR